jgi:hypothetical protein
MTLQMVLSLVGLVCSCVAIVMSLAMIFGRRR